MLHRCSKCTDQSIRCDQLTHTPTSYMINLHMLKCVMLAHLVYAKDRAWSTYKLGIIIVSVVVIIIIIIIL